MEILKLHSLSVLGYLKPFVPNLIFLKHILFVKCMLKTKTAPICQCLICENERMKGEKRENEKEKGEKDS